jgi:spermidine synthase
LKLREEFGKWEEQNGISGLLGAEGSSLIPEVLTRLWEAGAPKTGFLLSDAAWEKRLSSRGTAHDETWQDDRSDFAVMKIPLSFPEAGDYPPDLTLIRHRMEVQELYGENVKGEGIPECYTLYKRKPGCQFNWENMEFTAPSGKGPELRYTVWMSDTLQERLMMWEAAKRSRGRVLCGGLGLGIFPQLALSLPTVESVLVLEMDPAVIEMIQEGWSGTPWKEREKCTIVQGSIEGYLESTREKFDTVYLDTWDAIYHEYLPHVNRLSGMAERVLKPGGEVLLWAHEMMIRHYLQTVKNIIENREKYANLGRERWEGLRHYYPLVHRFVEGFLERPQDSDEVLKTRAYEIAARSSKDMGVLKLSRFPGGEPALKGLKPK